MPLSVGAVVAVSSIIQSSLAFSILEGPSIYDVRAEEGNGGVSGNVDNVDLPL